MFFDNQLMHLALFYQKVPKLRASLKTDQNDKEKGKKKFPREIDAELDLGADTSR